MFTRKSSLADARASVVNVISAAPVGPSRPVLPVVAIVALLAASLLLLQWLPLDCEATVRDDSTIFLFIGQRLNHGAILYQDVWDHKPPLIFWINAAGLSLSGGSPRGVVLLAGLGLALFLGITWRLAWRSCGLLPASIALPLAVFLLAALARTPNSTEFFALPFQALAFSLYAGALPERASPRLGLALGLLCGVLFMLRPNLVAAPVVGLILMAWAALRQRRLATLLVPMACFCAGTLLVLLLVSLPFLAGSRFDSLLDATLLFNLHYSAQVGFARKLATLFYGFVLTSTFACSLFALAALAAHSAYALAHRARLPYGLIAAALLLALEALFSAVSGRGYLHYFIPWVLPLTVLTAFFWRMCLGLAQPDLDAAGSAPRVLAAGAFVLILSLLLVKESVSEMRKVAAPGRTADAAIVQLVSKVTGPLDPVYLWWFAGAHGTPFRLGRPSPHPLFHLTPVLHDRAAYLDHVGSLLPSLEADPPKVIVEFASKQLPPLFFTRRDGNDLALQEVCDWDPPAILAAKAHLARRYRRALVEPSLHAIVYLRADIAP